MKHFIKIFAVGLVGLSMLACASPEIRKDRRRTSSLKKSVQSYNDNIRWQRYGDASKYVKDDERDSFLEHYETVRDTLQITDFRIVSSAVNKDDEEKATAKVWVFYYELPSVTMQRKLESQTWDYDSDEEKWTIDLSKIIPEKPEPKEEVQ